jgi:hypothetical protein
MLYRVQSFLAVVWFGSTPVPSPTHQQIVSRSQSSSSCLHRWAAILKNVSIKAIPIHNFWEKKQLKRYNFVGQNFFHWWSDRKKLKKVFLHRWSDKIGSNLWIPLIKRHKFLDKMFFLVMKRFNIPKYKRFTDKATQSLSFLENVSITAIVPLTELSATWALLNLLTRKSRP